jgi:hypothetical protein
MQDMQDLRNSGVGWRQNVWLGGCRSSEVSIPMEVSITEKKSRKKSVPGK